MPVKFVCDECRRMLSVSRRKIGTAIDCPCCGHGLHVPTEADATATIEAMEERRELRRLKRELKFPDLAVYDEPHGASAAPAKSLSDPRLHQHVNRQSRPRAKSRTHGTRNGSLQADALNGAESAAETSAKTLARNGDKAHDVAAPSTDWTKNDSRLVIDDSGDGDELNLPVVTPPAAKTRVIEPAPSVAVPESHTSTSAPDPAIVRAQPANNERLDRHRRAQERRGRWLKAVGIMAFGVGLFTTGWFAGRSGISGADWIGHEITITGGVMYTRANGETAADIGAVVVALPVGVYPQQRVDISGLLPGEQSLDPNHPGVLAIEEFGGAYARADATGEFQLQLPGEGEYLVLMVSSHSSQSGAERISVEDDAELSRYFTSGAGLVGKQRYRLGTEHLGEEQSRVSHLFRVGG